MKLRRHLEHSRFLKTLLVAALLLSLILCGTHLMDVHHLGEEPSQAVLQNLLLLIALTLSLLVSRRRGRHNREPFLRVALHPPNDPPSTTMGLQPSVSQVVLLI